MFCCFCESIISINTLHCFLDVIGIMPVTKRKNSHIMDSSCMVNRVPKFMQNQRIMGSISSAYHHIILLMLGWVDSQTRIWALMPPCEGSSVWQSVYSLSPLSNWNFSSVVSQKESCCRRPNNVRFENPVEHRKHLHAIEFCQTGQMEALQKGMGIFQLPIKA